MRPVAFPAEIVGGGAEAARGILVVGLVGLVLAVAGCEIKVGDEEPALPKAAEMVDGTEVWDLQQRPLADDVGIDGDDVAVFESRPARPMLVRLPDDKELRLSARYIALSAIGSSDDQPTSVDIKTGTKPLEDLVADYRSIVGQLGLRTEEPKEFAREASKATGTEWVRSDRVAGTFGDLELGVVARYTPHSKRGLIAIVGGWRAK